MKRICLLGLSALTLFSASSTVENIMPTPKKVCLSEGEGFSLGRPVRLSDPTGSFELQNFIASCGLLPDSRAKAVISVITGAVEGAEDYNLPGYPDESYRLSVSKDSIVITAPTTTGVTRAAQTLGMLAEGAGGRLECVTITDWPAFKLRGYMHDVGRSFIPVDELKRQIDLLSRFKVNTFHWHLTDNTGWRLQIMAFPQLTAEESLMRFPGKFYTQSDAREIQEYGARRGVTVIPEIDMPGHSGPFCRAMGHDMLSKEGIAELKVILSEVANLFDKSPYIHIGGDELNFPDSYMTEMVEYVHSLGKKAIIWNHYNYPGRQVDPAVIPVDMTTNWGSSGVISPGVPNVDMRYKYLNHFDVFADVPGIYRSTVFDVDKGNEDIAGVISAIWNDTMVPGVEDIMRQNNFYANVIAASDRAWIGGGNQYIEQGGAVLPEGGEEFDDFADWERRFLHHKSTTLAEVASQIPYVRQTDVRWRITDQIPNGGNPAASLPPEKYIGADSVPESFLLGGCTYGSSPAVGAGIYLRHIWHPIVKGHYENPVDSVTSYAWTYVWSPQDQEAGALVEFYTYSRSGNEKAPRKGEWDRRGSRLWLNGREIPAPEWSQPDADILQDQIDTGLTNENFTARRPVNLHLSKGWNQVFLKLPHADSGGTKRDKWQFTFVLTDPQGDNALSGIIYSPSKTPSVGDGGN